MPVLQAKSRLLLLILVCSVTLPWSAASDARAEDWPQWRGPARDGVWREEGIVEQLPQDGDGWLPRRWSVPIGPGYSGPTVADGRVYVTDRQANEADQVERILCFSEATGELLWKHTYQARYTIDYKAGPRACVTIDQGRAYALGAMGHLHCLDAATGKLHWMRDLDSDYQISRSRRMPIWGIAAAPLIVGELVVLQLGAEDHCLVALNKLTGKQVWSALDDRASYSAPITYQQAGTSLVLCWTGDSIAGVEAETGKVAWRLPFQPRNMPIGIATPVVRQNRVFVTSFYDGSMLVELDPAKLAARQVYHRVGRSERDTDALQSIMSTPVWIADHIYGVDSYGELRCLTAADGERVWEDQTATPRDRWSNIHLVQNADKVWMFNEAGELLVTRLSPKGLQTLSRAKLLAPTPEQLSRRRRGGVCWSHPAFANRHVFARNDRELVSVSLAK